MPIVRFPDCRNTGPEGLLAVGGDLHPDSLLLAYRQGIFPWPMDGHLCWFCPPERAVLDFSELHVSRTLRKHQKRTSFRLSINEAFDAVIESCAELRKDTGTWLLPRMITAYKRFHRMGYAISAEAWSGSELVGGIYGVLLDGTFSAESMFYRQPYASKLALLHLIEYLRSQEIEWMDIQQLTPHMEAMGAKLISRDQFLARLAHAHAHAHAAHRPEEPSAQK